jgi:hypothetical protein
MRIPNYMRCCAMVFVYVLALAASENHGQVKFGGLPLPGATVTATQGERKLTAITDQQGNYSFPDLADGSWTMQVEMLCFSTLTKEVKAGADAPAEEWDLKLLPMDQIQAAAGPPPAPAAATTTLATKPAEAAHTPPKKLNAKNAKAAMPAQNTPGGFQKTDVNASASAPAQPAGDSTASGSDTSSDLSQRAADGFLINGSSNNGASSPFALGPAFGNNRRGPRSMYSGNLGLILDNSALDAQSYSETGQVTPKPAYNRLTGVASFGGPLNIPHLIKNGPNLLINYQWLRARTAQTQPGLMPTAAERSGDLSQLLVPIFDPSSGLPFAGNIIPLGRISPQAKALLNLYPLPNFDSSRFNYQVPIVGVTHQDSLQTRGNKTLGRKNQLSGSFAFQSTRADNPTLLGFLDTTDTLGLIANLNWRHTFTPRFFGTLGYQYSRQRTRVEPFFENRENISGNAGISGNDQESINFGPPSLVFAGGTTRLYDSQQSLIRNETGALSYSMFWNHSPHNVTFGADYRRQQFNYLNQQDPRGTFTFTGAATQKLVNGVPVAGTGSDFADFLLGVPDASSIAFGNADKYFRATSDDAYITDDWRISPGLTLNYGMRWEYGSPITELYGRLVNLDIAQGYSAIAPVVANHPTGSLTGQKYPDSLVQPDKHAFQPRIGISWRPFPASSMIVRAGYGVNYNTSVYQAIANQMAQQSPLSKSLAIANTPANPLTLANGFTAPPGATTNTFAIDPNFRVGYTQTWQVSVQRDLPGSLVMTATYLGIKGTRGMQEFLPNAYPSGVTNPCLTCPSGYAFLTSNGNSTRESGSIQLRRRLHSGFTSTVQYTYAKSIDDATLGGGNSGAGLIAQNWLDLSAERGLSSFDQRHLLSVQTQYSTGMGMAGGAMLTGWKGTLFKDWTFTSQITVGSGLPLTPIVLAPVQGTGVTGPIRPDYTGAPLYDAPPGLFLNPAAYTIPATGHWGNAGRDSITGPGQFTLNGSMGRTFRLTDRFSLDARVDATNALNHVTYSSWNTIVNSSQFGLPPASANAMRSLQTTFRVRF